MFLCACVSNLLQNNTNLHEACRAFTYDVSCALRLSWHGSKQSKAIEGFGERFLIPTSSQKPHPAFFLASAP
jgi:hypothetical protein